MKRLYLIVTLALGFFCQGLSAQNKGGYNPEVFALESGRGNLSKEYFGVMLSDVEKDSAGNYVLTDEQRTTIEESILGNHLCSLQWISWTDFGKVTFSRSEDGKILCSGGQKATDGGDYLKIEGEVSVVSPLHIRITGTITTKVSHINGGKPVLRKGTYNFTIAGARRYWRMREMSNPSDHVTDYIDIYF